MRSRARATALLCAVLFSSFPRALMAQDSEAPLSVTLRVPETAGVTRANEPVTSGVPIPRSANLLSTSGLGVFDGGVELPSQFRVLARWDGSPSDGSRPIKWLLVDTQVGVSPYSVKSLQLRTGGSGGSGSPLAVQAGGIVTVVTGPLKFTVDQGRFQLLSGVWYDPLGRFASPILSPGGTLGGFVQSGSSIYSTASDTPSEFAIEENGPLRAVIKIKGRHRSGSTPSLGYVARIYAYKDKSYVRIVYSYYNGNLASDFQNSSSNPADDIDYSSVWMNLGLTMVGPKRFIMGKEAGASVSGTLSTGGSVWINANNADDASSLVYALNNQGTTSTVSRRAEGWADLSDVAGGLTVADRWFWQRYEKRLTVSDGGSIRLDLSENDKLREAQGLSDDVTVYFHGPNVPEASITPIVFGFAKNPLYAKASSNWYRQSGAFAPLPPVSPLRYPNCGNDVTCLMDYDLDANFSQTLQFREANLLYGGLNFGGFLDRNTMPLGSSRDADLEHGVNYYDGVYVIAHNFVRRADVEGGSGDGLAWLGLLTEAARHYMETEAYHVYPDNPYDDGGVDRTNYNGLSPAYEGYYRDNVHVEHCWGSGLFYYYYLTGDERARERALEGATSLLTNDYVLSGGGSALSAGGVWLGRLCGQSLDWLAHAYELTRDPAYAARLTTAMNAFADNIAGRSNFRDVGMRQVVGVLLPAMFRAWDITGRTRATWANAITTVANWTMKEDRNPSTGQIEGNGYYGDFLGYAGYQASGECTGRVWFLNVAGTSQTFENHWACYPQTNLELMGGLWAAAQVSGSTTYRDFLLPLYKNRLQDLADESVPGRSGFVGFGRATQSLRNAIHLNTMMRMAPTDSILPSPVTNLRVR